ncbi:hypothetical protein CkaCkLH20_00767 [Colletotrichum karsti]|uniref:2EXR domain-containing protein n=1 Tax=Colletotrichum karsti TaxID=1095194 RepID=A0A9P6IGG9_9PEZI|nr:uncharacterized protein CkaCkLH20_00767 [Colletotrichum karsti]KAF9881621.1 hypothetical protein CkaCkLH20_00767 [Colletotrichum karsti]
MAKTFHSFSRLPAELRLCIWETAVGPSGPNHAGVHFFSLHSRIEDDRDRGPFVTTIPPFKGESKSPWKETEENPSTYFFDFGMWMACRESRTVVIREMSRRFAHQKGDPVRSFVRARYNQEEITFGLRPRDDLICVRFSEDPKAFEIYDLYDVLDIRLHRPEDCYVFPYMDIAFEYDASSWTFDPKEAHIVDLQSEPGPRGAFLTILEQIIQGEIRATLFLIEYGATLKPDGRAYGTFYGNGFNFASVAEDDVEMECTEGRRMDAWEFIDAVDECGEGWWKGEKDNQDGYGLRCRCCELLSGEHIGIHAASHIGVLVCQEA